MEKWRRVFREGIVPLASVAGLEALRKALASDSKKLIQGDTTSPPPLVCVRDWACESACPIAYLGWQNGEGLRTVGEVEDFFSNVCHAIDQVFEEPGMCRHFVNWFDEKPREEVRQELLSEVRRALPEPPGPVSG